MDKDFGTVTDSTILGTRVEESTEGLVEPCVVIPKNLNMPKRGKKSWSLRGYKSDGEGNKEIKSYSSFKKSPSTLDFLNTSPYTTDSDEEHTIFTRDSEDSDSILSLHSCHDFVDTEGQTNRYAIPKLCVASVVSICFIIFEAIGARYASSLVIYYQLSHLICDLIGFLASIITLSVVRRPPTATLSFGYYRAEILGSLVNVLVVWVITGLIGYCSVLRIISHDYQLNPRWMVPTSAVALLANVMNALVLHGFRCRGYYHHGSQKTLLPKRHQIALRTALAHCTLDLVISSAILLVSVALLLNPKLEILDPITTVISCSLMFLFTFPVISDVTRILMEGCPKNISYVALFDDLESISGVKGIHNLHVWSLGSGNKALTVHIGIDARYDPQVVLKMAQKLLKKRYDFCRSTIQVEFYKKEMDFCPHCQLPSV